MTSRVPALFAVLGLVVAIALFLVLKDDTADEDTTVATTTQGATAGDGKEKPANPPKPELPLVEIRGGMPVDGVRELEFESGEEASFEVTADAADELHLHGYDIYVDLAPGRAEKVRFRADIEGLFELESHTTGEAFAEISVVP